MRGRAWTVILVSCVIFAVGQAGVPAPGSEECACESKLSLRTKAGVKAASTALAASLGTTALGSSFVGFTAVGIAKGSLAAFIQAKVGVFGVFSLLQSLGATGAFALGGPPGLIAAAAVGTASYFWFASGSDDSAEGRCTCDNGQAASQEELLQLFALKKIESCVEPSTRHSRVCSERGLCDYDKEEEELFCKCHPGHSGTYCEISESEKGKTAERCRNPFLQRCAQCLIRKFTLAKKGGPQNCFDQCTWERKVFPESENRRPDVGSVDLRRVIKMDVVLGTPCRISINETCTTELKYYYEHHEDHLDQLIVFYSSDEAHCVDTSWKFGVDKFAKFINDHVYEF